MTTLASRFGPLPLLHIDRIGYGAGNRNPPGTPNLLRLIVGEIEGEVMTVKIDGSGWSNAIAPTGEKRRKSYL